MRDLIEHKAQWATSVEGRAIELYQKRTPQVQPFLFVGGVHGDEPEGVELARRFLDWLTAEEEGGGSVHPWILIPCLNPDGYLRNQRCNAHGVDLNRNYPSPDWSPLAAKPRYAPGPKPASEPEIKAIVDLIEEEKPSLIVHFHSWNPCIVYTGFLGAQPTQFLSERSPYEGREDIGYPTPGSLGQYGWMGRQTPVICIEEQQGIELDKVWGHFARALSELMTQYTQDFRAIVFDLDDTLLDTSGRIVPAASRGSLEILFGPSADEDRLKRAEVRRQELSRGLSHRKIFFQIAQEFGVKDLERVEKATQLFYQPQIPKELPLLEGALENLRSYQGIYDLYLVTKGHGPTQKKKIQALGVENYFNKIFVCDSDQGDDKAQAFRKIQNECATRGIHPWQILSIGNRLSSEIREAKRVGAHTCYMAFGEHLGEEPQLPEDHPDFTIYKMSELSQVCRLKKRVAK